MDSWSIFVGLLLSMILILFLLLWKPKKKLKLPPGPTPLPLIGNLHMLGKKPHQSLAKLAQKYGPVMSLKLGWMTTVVISSSSTAKEVLQKQDLAFSTRSVPDAVHAHNHYLYSVPWLPVGTKWKSLRKILTTVVFSNNRLDANHPLRTRIVQDLIAHCRVTSLAGQAVDIGQSAFLASTNLISNTIFSKDVTDLNQHIDFKQLISSILTEAGIPNLADFFPPLKKIDPQGIRRRSALHMGKILQLFGRLINERLDLRKLHKTDGNGDLLDVCLDVREQNPNEIDIANIQSLCLDLFAAGTDTSSSTIEWAMAEALHNPEIMMKAKAELDQVIGKGKILEEVDISRLPYLQCIVKETLRLHPPVPFLLPRKVVSDAQVNGYTIPKGSQVLVNAWAIGRDPSLWEDSLAFKPERFLTSEIDVRGRDFELIPFGAGRRICPGMLLGMRMVHVMLGSLINSFDWKLNGGQLDMTEKFGLSLNKATPLLLVPVESH